MRTTSRRIAVLVALLVLAFFGWRAATGPSMEEIERAVEQQLHERTAEHGGRGD